MLQRSFYSPTQTTNFRESLKDPLPGLGVATALLGYGEMTLTIWKKKASMSDIFKGVPLSNHFFKDKVYHEQSL